MGHAKLVDTNPEKKYPKFLLDVHQRKNISRAKRPTILDMQGEKSIEKLKSIIKTQHITEVIDNYGEQYAELLLSQNAHLYRANHSVQVSSIKEMLDEHYGSEEPWRRGSWVYYPWSGRLVHVLARKDFEELRTIRNRDLITKKEQTTLRDFSAACFGMSVGSAGALALSISGISKHIKLVDGAVISGSNLNRILAGVESVGENKAETIGHKIFEANPYANVEYFSNATKDNIKKILSGDYPANIVIDEIDDIEMKIQIRLQARQLRIPVVMATELGDTIMLDVERFDLEPKKELFHGMLKDIESVAKSPPKTYREWTKHAVNIIDPTNMPLKMQKSLLKIGSSIVTHPQLGSTVMMTGGVLAFAVKSIALNQPLKSGRYVISLEKELLANHQTRQYRRRHKKHTKIIHRATDSM